MDTLNTNGQSSRQRAHQLDCVREAMTDGEEWTLADLAILADASATSVSARVRDLRKPEFGGHVVTRRYAGRGVFLYRLEGRRT